MKFRVLIETDEDGAFVAEVPSLPGCISQGETRQEALRNIEEAISAYVESLQARDEPIREAIVSLSENGSYAIRQGPWKLIIGTDVC